jgi:hypothetical protein
LAQISKAFRKIEAGFFSVPERRTWAEYGSGRSGRYVSIEGCQSYVLNAAFLNRARFPRGAVGKTRITYRGGFEVEVGIYSADGPELRLKHYPNNGGDDPIEYAVPLTYSTPRFGGLRWWFRCPATWQRCCKLYLPNGGRRFLSRQAYRLRYASQVQTRLARLQRQSMKLNRALGGDGGHDWIPERPKGMWQRTYERLAGKLERYIDDADAEWSRGAMALLVRAGMWPPR